MISFSDFKNEDGSTNWKAYKAAQVECGEICSQCFEYISLFQGNNGFPRYCYSCRDLSKSGSVDHRHFVRCPHCSMTWRPGDDGDYHVFSDGEHDVTCYHCDKSFVITTNVSYSFESPELIEKKIEESEEDSDDADTGS